MKPYIFEQIRSVQPEDLDELRHVNNVRYLQWVQDVAEAHWKSQAPTEIQQNFIWVVLSHFIEYKSPVHLDDEVLVRTYVGEVSGPKYDRHVEIWKAKEEKLCVKAHSVWCLLDTESHRPKKVTDDIRRIFEDLSS
jgi:acyl-CoA thioester hydrolase